MSARAKSNTPWVRAIKGAADPNRARHFLELFTATPVAAALRKKSPEEIRVLVTLFSGSQALSTWLLAHPESLNSLNPETLRFARRKQGFVSEVDAWLDPALDAGDFGVALARLREFKQREMLRVGARDLIHPGNPDEITQELSDLADVCLNAVWRLCWRRLQERYGRPYHQNAANEWRETAACVVGLGKLGGQELNYSSDVDVIIVYEEEGNAFKTSPRTGSRPTLTNHQFFERLTEAFVGELTRLAPEGMLHRIDLRLRPEGDAGPLSRSLAGYENYYAQWGQTWERMMLIKGRVVAGSEVLANEFLELIQPFRYPRSTNENVLREVAAMKSRIENEVVRAGELERNVKLGRGGIREIEFIVQVLQLLHAGQQPFLQGAQTLMALRKLVQYELLTPAQGEVLARAYRFLRDVEHRLQMDDNRQTHTIPADRPARERLARLMGFAELKLFDTAFQSHTNSVRTLFEKILGAEVPAVERASVLPTEFIDAEEDWKRLLEEHRFKDVPRALRLLREFVEGPGYVHVSPRTKDVALQLLARLFALCTPDAPVQRPKAKVQTQRQGSGPQSQKQPRTGPKLSDPDRVLNRLDNFLSAYGARATLFELWNSNPGIFELLVLLFDRSEFLAELAIRSPDLVDELVTSGRLRQRKSAEETLRDLRHGLEDADQPQWLRRYHQAELMRIGLRDILGLADFEQYLTELSALADACLQYAMEVVMKRHRLKHPPFAIIGLGKLGGQEIDYGSDLDILFVAGARAKNLVATGRLALEVMELLSTRTQDGVVFHTDARLRPDGEKGLLVNTLAAYEQYYRRRSQLWEIQSLSRARFIVGPPETGRQFQSLCSQLTDFRHPSLPLAAYGPDWKQRIHQMRLRIEKERTPRGKDELAIKTGSGGLMDAEFIAQVLSLEHGWHEPNTLRALERAVNAGLLTEPETFLDCYRRLRRVEGILRRWSYEGETVLPDDPAPYYRVSIRCGFETPQAFRQALAKWRKTLRDQYSRVLLATPR